MARKPRSIRANLVYHVMNRASARTRCFHTDGDYAAFETVLDQAVDRFHIRLLSYCVMPNHFHLVLWPNRGQEQTLSHFMKWLQQTHTQRWHAHYHNAGTGRLYQGRFRAFPVQTDWDYYSALRRVCRYVERNPLRAKLVQRAEQWPWSAAHRRLHGTPDQKKTLAPWPKARGEAFPGNARWLALLNSPMRRADEAAVQLSLARDRPLGTPQWTTQIAAALDLTHTLRPRGRPKKSLPKRTASS